MNPLKRRNLVRSISGASGKAADRLWQVAVNRSMTVVEASCRPNRLIARTERHGEGEPERAVEPANAVDENARMLGNGMGDPRMGKLQEERATGPDE